MSNSISQACCATCGHVLQWWQGRRLLHSSSSQFSALQVSTSLGLRKRLSQSCKPTMAVQWCREVAMLCLSGSTHSEHTS